MTLVAVGGLYRICYRMPSCVLFSPCAAEMIRRFGKEFPMKFGADQTPWAGYRSSGRVLCFWSCGGIVKPRGGE